MSFQYRMNKVIVVVGAVLGLTAIVLAGACAPSEEATVYEWRWGDTDSPDSPHAQSSMRFADEVRERTDGRIDITVYPGEALGDWVQVCSEVSQGTVEGTLSCLPTDYDKRLNVVYTPLLVTDYEEARAAYAFPDGWLYVLLDELAAEQNMKLLGCWPSGFGCCSFKGDLPEGLMDPTVDKRMKMRVWPAKTAELWSECMGYTPTPIAWAELFTSMQQGVIETQVGGTPYINWDHLRDVTDHLVFYRDHLEAHFFILNLDLWNSLPDELQQMVGEVASEEANKQWEECESTDLEYLQKFRDYGANVVIPTEEEFRIQKQHIRDCVWPQLPDVLGQEVVDYLLANAPD